ncbi:MAG: S9 family peptidase [Candidatus Thorarchaeota archaeon]|nr:S9 family peptidase [Candidatus Thorarchaeota archaeon]
MPSYRALDLDSLMSIPSIDSYEISPQKTHLALSIDRIQENYDIFLLSIDEPRVLTPLTNTPELTSVEDWAPDSKSVLVGEDTARDERVTLYRVFLDDPGNMIPVTEAKPNFFLRGGSFGPRGDFIAYSVNYDYDTKKETETFRVVVHDLESSTRIVIARPDKATDLTPFVDPNGRYVLYNRADEDPSGTQWWIASIDGNEDREILNFGPKAKVNADWTHDGRVLFDTDTIDGVRHDSVGIGLYDISSGEIHWLSNPTERGVYSSSEVPRYSNHVVFVEEQNARKKTFILDLDTDVLQNATPHRGTLSLITNLANGDWLGVYYSSTHPGEIVRFNLNELSPSRFTLITDLLGRTTIQREDLVPAQDVRWISADDTPIHGWLYPARNPNGKTIVRVHGGPTAHSEDEFGYGIQYLCSLGFNILEPNYRGSTGYGVRFRELIKQDGWGGLDKEDIRSGIEHLIENGIALSYKVGITGTSYGGYMSWLAITQFPPGIIAAAAPICGMTDLVVDYETTRPDLRTYSEEMLGGSPNDVPEIYRERSPINYVQNIRGRLLIVQGLRDPNVTKANMLEVEKRLEANKIRYEKLVFDDEGHGIVREKNVKILLGRLAEFFEESL